MTTLDVSATIDHLAARLADDHRELAHRWLERLDQLLTVEPREVFPTHQLLDHIPDLILEIAAYLRAPETQEIAANTAVMAKAAELGLLRFDQQASVHQLLREYQIFGEILDDFFAREAAELGDRASVTAMVRAVARASQAVRVLQQKTVDAFIARYVETIERQTGQLRSFSRLLSHEIRQPLGVLQVLSRLLASREPDPETSALIESLERNVVRLGEVAGKLERLARLTRRPDAGPGEQVVDLTAIGRDVATQLAEMAQARGVAITVEEELPLLRADAGRVELVLMNLLANAVKYSDPGKPARTVWLRRVTDGHRAAVSVVDNGLGIPAATLQRIFDQFVRAHAHLDDELNAQGLGLGLSIVRESMDAMDGTVAVESTEGVGTTFTLRWPEHAIAPGRPPAS